MCNMTKEQAEKYWRTICINEILAWKPLHITRVRMANKNAMETSNIVKATICNILGWEIEFGRLKEVELPNGTNA
jgi:hypothetical protein